MSVALAAAVVIFQLACPIVIASQGSELSAGASTSVTDAARYRAIVELPGRPYRDFEVEYPPLALGIFHAVGPSTYPGFRERLFALQVVCQALIVLLLFRFWSGRAGWAYLLLSAPMMFVVYGGFDLVAVAIAVGAATLVRRKHAVSGALGFVLGAFVKVWPGALLPGLLAARKARAFAVGVAAAVAGLAAWTAWGGSDAAGQVLSYRGARGWEFESLPGVVLRLLTGDALRFENGSWRVGAPPRFFTVLLSVVVVGAVAVIWWLASRRPDLPAGLAEVAVIGSLLGFGTLLSPQFLVWILPFVAIAAGAGVNERLQAWALAAASLTLLDRIVFDPARPALLRTELVVLARNVALIGLLVVAIVEIRRVLPADRAPVAA
jgi:hypothetical protein